MLLGAGRPVVRQQCRRSHRLRLAAREAEPLCTPHRHAATVLADREAGSQQPRRRRGRKQRGLRTTGCTGRLLDLVAVSDSWSTRKQAVLGAAKQTEAESV